MKLIPSKVVPASGPVPAPILIVGEAPGATEEQQGRPFIGASGHELTKMLGEAGIDRNQCRLTNVFRVRPPGNDLGYFIEKSAKRGRDNGYIEHNGKWVRPDRCADIEELFDEIERTEPNLIILAGGTPLWAVAGLNSITDVRGNLGKVQVRGSWYKWISTFHPASILRQWTNRQITVHDLKRARRESLRPELVSKVERFIVSPTFAQASDFLTAIEQRLSRGPVELTMDLETRSGRTACTGIGTSKEDAICIPWMSTEHVGGHYWSLAEELVLLTQLQRILLHPNVRLINQNMMYDMQYIFEEMFCKPAVHWDVMYAHHVLFPVLRNALGFQVTLYAEQPRYWKADGKTWEKSMPEEILWTYNCRDCTYTFEVYEEQQNALRAWGLEEQFRFLQDLFDPVRDMLLRGTRISLEKRREFRSELDRAERKFLDEINSMLGLELNVRSPQQMQALFYEDFGFKKVINRKTGRPTTDDSALDTIERRHPIVKPLIQRIKAIRSIGVFRGTFIDAKLSDDNRLRTFFNVAGTKTFRFSSSKNAFDGGTNLQNIPRPTNALAEWVQSAAAPAVHRSVILRAGFKQRDLDEAEAAEYITIDPKGFVHYEFVLPAVRKIFVPDEGYTLIDMDLDRADAQVVAWEANDETLKQMFREGIDIHSENAKVIKSTRQMAKTFVHATNYVGSARTVASHCGILVKEAEEGQRRWFEAHPGIKDWHKRTAVQLRSTGIIENKFGFKINFFDRPDSILPEAVAWIPQSTVALVINKALLNIHRNLSPTVQPLLQVHDSLVMQTPTALTQSLLPKIREQSLITVPYPDPLVIPVGFKTSEVSWGDCKEIEIPNSIAA